MRVMHTNRFVILSFVSNPTQEAYVKAQGKGMNAIPFRSFSFSMDPSADLMEECREACKCAADVSVEVR